MRRNVRKRTFRTCAPCEVSDQYAHLQSDQNLHCVHFYSKGCKVSSCGQRSLKTVCADAQTDLSFRWMHNPEGTFSHVEAHIMKTYLYNFEPLKPHFYIVKLGFTWVYIVGIKHGFSCINIRQVPRGVLKTEAGGRGFQHLPRDLANVNAMKNHVRSLLLHKN